MFGKKKRRVDEDVNRHILNMITPSGFSYDSRYCNLGENIGKIYFISKYPMDQDFGWLANLCNLEGTITMISYRNTTPERLVKANNNKIKELNSEKGTAKDESRKQEIDQNIKDIKVLVNRIHVKKEPVGYVNIAIFIQADNQRNLEDRIKRVSASIATEQCNIKNLTYRQQLAIQGIAPYGIPNYEDVTNVGERNMPISTVLGGFAMANPGINDKNGCYIGKTKNNKMVIVDFWKRAGDRVNSNMFISGIPGSGKSTLVKLIMLLLYALGTKNIVYDPDGEYVDFVQHDYIDGEVIDASGGTRGRINPLHIITAPRITESDLEADENIGDYFVFEDELEGGISDMALHIQQLRIFFMLRIGKDEYNTNISSALEKCLIKAYNEKGIHWNTDINKLKAEDFPILEDVYNIADEETRNPIYTERRRSFYEDLTDYLYPLVHGADKYLWNGPTTLDLKSRFVVINCKKLLDLDEKVKRAQFFLLQMWGWQQASSNRTDKVMLYEDEGYNFVDPEYPDMMKYNRNISKRLRKYEGGLAFITHSAVDVLDEKVKLYGQALLDNSCFKFLMGTDGKNLKETAQLFDLTDKEIELLAEKTRGKGIMMAGNTRLELNVDVAEEFLEIFGSGGGR